jgi:hypothetical protein
MKYNSDSVSNDCVSEILLICGATTATYSLNNITRRFNSSLDDYFDLAFSASRNWPVDDLNAQSAAITTQNLRADHNAYAIGSFIGVTLGSAVNVLGITIYDDDGKITKLTREDFAEMDFETNYDITATGEPQYYTKFGNYIYVRPTPNYTEANGLRAYVEREPLYMLPSDTNKEPGIPRKHHMYLCRKTSLSYLIDHNLPSAGIIAQQILKDEVEIKQYYATRDKDRPQRMTVFEQDNE